MAVKKTKPKPVSGTTSKVAARPKGTRSGVEPAMKNLANVGPAAIKDFEVLKITTLADLATRDAYVLYNELCRLTTTRHDPCVIDVLLSAVEQARDGCKQGKRARSWWTFTEERKAALKMRPDLIPPRWRLPENAR